MIEPGKVTSHSKVPASSICILVIRRCRASLIETRPAYRPALNALPKKNTKVKSFAMIPTTCGNKRLFFLRSTIDYCFKRFPYETKASWPVSEKIANYRVFHNCWNKAIGHKSRILNDTTMMITFIERWKDKHFIICNCLDPIPACALQKTQKCQVLGSFVAEICSDSDRLSLEP